MCQPQRPDWETLLDRLSPLPAPAASKRGGGPAGEPGSRRPLRRPFRAGALAAAAAVVCALVLGWLLRPAPDRSAHAEPLPIEVRRRGIEVTVFSAGNEQAPTLYMPVAEAPGRDKRSGAPVQGMALVRDQRMILHLRQGDNVVKFTDVAATIDPTSVRLVSDTDPLGTKVVEQNFEFDLAGAEALLERSLEHRLTCVGKDGQELARGYLLSFDGDSIVLADRKPPKDPGAPRPKTQAIARDKLAAIRLEHVPGDLHTRPTLVWKLRADKPGDHLTTLTYLCGGASWRADYVAEITQSKPGEVTLDLACWVTMDNRSGASYEEAGLKLIAGDVHRVHDPWAPREGARVALRGEVMGQRLVYFGKGLVPRFIEKDLFEYKLYQLDQPSTIKDRQIKQLGLFQAEGVRARRRYICRSAEGSRLHPQVQLLVKNEKQNRLGRPLPKGKLALAAADADGDVHLLGRWDVDHTAKDEELKIMAGRALDVVYDFRVVHTRRPTVKRMIRTYEFRIRNHKPSDVRARAIGHLRERQKIWSFVDLLSGATRGTSEVREATTRSVIEASDEYFLRDHTSAHFDVLVKADSEKIITYTVDYRW